MLWDSENGKLLCNRYWVSVWVNEKALKVVLGLRVGQPKLCFSGILIILNWSSLKLKLNGSMKSRKPSRTNTQKDILYIIGDQNAKVGSQELPGVTGKFGLGVQNEAGQRPTAFCQENTLVTENTLFQQHKRWLYTWMSPDGNTEIRLIIIFVAKDGEALYSQQKQDQELTVAEIIRSL